MNRANMTSFRFDPIYLGRSEQENAINKFRKINYSLCSCNCVGAYISHVYDICSMYSEIHRLYRTKP